MKKIKKREKIKKQLVSNKNQQKQSHEDAIRKKMHKKKPKNS